MRREAVEELRMARGGARNRSGPQADPDSLRSAAKAAKGVVLTALPREGYAGEVPEFPLPDCADRERAVWEQAWRTPQAAAWAGEPWRWRTVAMWVRWSVRMEATEAGAALGTVVVRLADQIGMTPAGLKENGWAVAKDEVAQRRAAGQPAAARRPSARDRLKAASGGDA